MNRKERKIVRYLVQASGRLLGDSMNRLGGERARQGLLEAFDAAAAEKSIGRRDGEFHIDPGEDDWEKAEAVLGAVIDHAATVIGSNTVQREVGKLLDDTEAKAGASLYEIYFRLGLNSYR